MPLIAAKILVGFVVGILIGMTGVGGGVLMLPVLIFGLGYSPIVAVGSDAIFQFFTKIPAGLLHLKNGTVRRKVVLALALGSVPGSFAGVKLLIHIRLLYGNGVNTFIKLAVGLLLIVIPIMLLLQKNIEDRIANRAPTMKGFAGMVMIGLTVGFIVGLTSVGSGSIIMMLLLLFYSFPPKINVGTDVVHAVILFGVTGLLQYKAHNVDFPLVVALLIGSIPGGLIGSHLATRVPMLWLRRMLCALLLITGARMLWPA
jgi:uncharacterized membrane protein YfcA